MKKIVSLILVLVLALTCIFSLASCGDKAITIAIPNDTTNEARALRLLEAKGLITLKAGSGETATIRDIESNPFNIEFKETEAALIPNVLADVDYAVINSNYAIEAKLTPIGTEGTDVSYPNIIAVKSGNENTDLVKALVAAINSQAVKNFIETQYAGAIVCDLTDVTADGLDISVNYAALNGQTIKIAASATPHAPILEVAKTILQNQGITLQIDIFTDYVQPNNVVFDGQYLANFFQHIPYLNDFNQQNSTDLVSVLAVHHEPMGIYTSNKVTTLIAK